MTKLTLSMAENMMAKADGHLDLSGAAITALPDGLTVGGSIRLRGTKIPVIYNDPERDYKLRAVRCRKEVWYVAGCRLLTGKNAALAHWGGDEHPNKARGQAFCDAINAAGAVR